MAVMVLPNRLQMIIALLILFIVPIVESHIDPGSHSSTERRTPTASNSSLFVQCPSPREINATAVLTRVWWTSPAVYRHLVRSLVRKTGFPPGSLFPEGRHSVIYEARSFDGRRSTCEVTFTINVIRCDRITLTWPTIMRCTAGNLAYSRCRFYCPSKYQLTGSPRATCRTTGQWSGTLPTCKLIICDQLSAPAYSSMVCSAPPSNRQGSWCQFRCFPGSKMIGSSVRTCLLPGKWSGIQPSCRDSQPPRFTFCPGWIRQSNEDGTSSAVVNYQVPVAVDESNVTITLIMGQPPGSRFRLGLHRILYRASDESGNTADCLFVIHVYDNQPPRFDFCPSPIHAFSTRRSSAMKVTYSTPTATDNASPDPVNVTRIYGRASGSTFQPGVYAIQYQATDESGNRAHCTFYIVVKVSQCVHLNEKDGLQMDCSDDLYHPGSWCTFRCNEGYLLSGSATRICQKTGWTGQEAVCSAVTSPADDTETVSKDEISTPIPLQNAATSSGDMETEIITDSISLAHYDYYANLETSQ